MTIMTAVRGMKPIRQRATNLKVYDSIREAITEGRLKPGDTLSTRLFAETLGVSQMPIREAFHRLVAEGALENRPNRTIGLPIFSLAEFDEIVEIRMLLEGLAARKCAENVSESQLEVMSGLASGMEAASLTQDNTTYLRLNRAFHFTVYRGSQSTQLVQLIDRLWLRVGPFLNWISSPSDSRSRSNTHHRATIAACRLRDGEAAEQAIRNDVRDGAEVVRARLGAGQIDGLPEAGTGSVRRKVSKRKRAA